MDFEHILCASSVVVAGPIGVDSVTESADSHFLKAYHVSITEIHVAEKKEQSNAQNIQ